MWLISSWLYNRTHFELCIVYDNYFIGKTVQGIILILLIVVSIREKICSLKFCTCYCILCISLHIFRWFLLRIFRFYCCSFHHLIIRCALSLFLESSWIIWNIVRLFLGIVGFIVSRRLIILLEFQAVHFPCIFSLNTHNSLLCILTKTRLQLLLFFFTLLYYSMLLADRKLLLVFSRTSYSRYFAVYFCNNSLYIIIFIV